MSRISLPESNDTYGLIQDTQVHYVNVFFGEEDKTREDLELLIAIKRRYLATGKATITSRRESNHKSMCLSMEIKGEYSSCSEIFEAAWRVVDAWIEEFPQWGMPFDRVRVFEQRRVWRITN